MVAVVGVSASSQAQLLAEIDALGTNLLTATPGTTFSRQQRDPAHELGADGGRHAQRRTATSPSTRSPAPPCCAPRTCPAQQTGGIGVDAAGENLPRVMGVSLAAGHFLDAVSARYPEVVLGAQAASVLQIESVGGHVEVYLGDTWFNVVGILKPVLLDSTLDSTAFISLPVAERLFQVDAQPVGDLPARERQPRARGGQPGGADRRSAERLGRRRQPPVGRARGPRRRQGPVHHAAAGAGRGGAARRRDRDRQHHGHLGARAPWRDRAAPRAGGHPAPRQPPVPHRVRAAGGTGQHRRPGPGGRRHRGLLAGPERALRGAAVRRWWRRPSRAWSSVPWPGCTRRARRRG